MALNIEINNRTKNKLDLISIKRIVSEFARINKIKQREISLAFVNDAEIKKINLNYRQIDQPTDILAFPGEGNFWGEIIIDYDQIKRQAGKFNNSFKQELIFILVHGLLHLLGHDDKTEDQRKKMIKLGEKFIAENINNL
jgi:probable rRNA maturation factor